MEVPLTVGRGSVTVGGGSVMVGGSFVTMGGGSCNGGCELFQGPGGHPGCAGVQPVVHQAVLQGPQTGNDLLLLLLNQPHIQSGCYM